MNPRMKSPLMVIPDALSGFLAANKATETSGLPAVTAKLVHLRASQINGCGFCVDMHAREMKHADQSFERIAGVAAWRESPYFTDAERAALALTESVTRIADNPEGVPDAVWDEAARHYDEKALAALVIHIALINTFNRINVPIRQVAGSYRP